jgi:hypothetical protein
MSTPHAEQLLCPSGAVPAQFINQQRRERNRSALAVLASFSRIPARVCSVLATTAS